MKDMITEPDRMYSARRSTETRTRPTGTGARRRLWAPLGLFIGAVMLVSGMQISSDALGQSGAGVGAATPALVETNWDSVYATIQERFTEVEPTVKFGCYDCHSSQTRYPWYHKLPIIKGWIDGHTREARKHLDFSDGFPFKGHTRAADNLLAMRNEILEGHMPPLYYRVMHWEAKPTGALRDSLVAWIDTSLRTLAAHGQYPLNRPDLVPQEIETE
jgi:hypothetical protein